MLLDHENLIPYLSSISSIYISIRGHPFMTSTRKGEGSSSGERMWTGRGQLIVDIHIEN